ncbi:MAG: hypothetical protein OXG35_04370 [Acidobacteria bacterium]|nr:hypothetical protein [Acidobacteriota bacterium]
MTGGTLTAGTLGDVGHGAKLLGRPPEPERCERGHILTGGRVCAFCLEARSCACHLAECLS